MILTSSQLDSDQLGLIENRDKLPPAARRKLKQLALKKSRGFRSNKFIDALRPNLRPGHPKDNPKQRKFLGFNNLEVIFGGAAGGGKLLSLDTPILTVDGWTTMGDIQVGDALFDENGKITRVIHTYKIDLRPQKTFEVTFDCGEKIVACGDHRWLTFTEKERIQLARRNDDFRKKRRKKRESRAKGNKSKAFTTAIATRNKACPPATLPAPTGAIRTTQEIFSTLLTRGRKNHSVPVAKSVFFPEKNFLVPPYVLGAWLGDGTTKAGTITCHPSDRFIIDHIASLGYETVHHNGKKQTSWGIYGLVTHLKKIGVYGNKHIPNEYIQSSHNQRLELLRGLMDTDGDCATDGGATFNTTLRVLAKQVLELSRSLGIKSSMSEGRAKLNGKDYGPAFRIKMTTLVKLFRLERKAERQPAKVRSTQRWHYIVGCRPVPSVPMRCIQVDSPSGLFLAGKALVPTHNSDALLLAALQYVDVPGYSAILFRRTYTDLAGEGALMNRAISWLAPFERSGDVRWSGGEKSYFFTTINPDGSPGKDSRLSFGYLDTDKDRYRYQGWEFQFVGFDELTQHPEDNYTYLFSRLRRLKGVGIPIRMRSATNPGGKFGEWVKSRFVPDGYLEADEETRFNNIWQKTVECGECGGTGRFEGDECFYCDGQKTQMSIFVPARLQDNKSLDRKQYLISLSKMSSPVERAQLEHGDWLIMEEGEVFKQIWFRHFEMRGGHFILQNPEAPDIVVDQKHIVRFLTADTASKEKTLADYTAICSWAFDTRNYNLMLLHVIREKLEIPKILPVILNQYRSIYADFVIIEESSIAIGLIQDARGPKGKGITVKSYIPGSGRTRYERDKVSRAATAANRAEAGQVYFPAGSPQPKWLQDFIAELITFPASEHDDQVDCFSMAAWYVNSQQGMRNVGMPQEVSSGPLMGMGMGLGF